jgi:poly-gamma-glutamate synthesis protein (capsule biosynthesis protein)
MNYKVMKLEKVFIGLILLLSLIFISWGMSDFFQMRQQQKEVINSPVLENAIVQVKPESSPASQPIRIIFGGDMMFDRHVREGIQKNGLNHPLGELTEFLSNSDLVIANLEGPVTSAASKSVNSEVGSTNNYIFTFDPQVIKILQQNNVQVVNLGNNHILNFGQDGLQQTYQNLNQNQIKYFGNTGNGLTDRTLIIERNGIKIGLVNYNQFVANSWVAVEEDLKELRPQVDLLIVYTHWGNEYQTTAQEPIVSQAHQLIDLGADAIIGSHPHVMQQKEIYQGKTIYYSLGNFVFDQYFQPEVQTGLLVMMEINASNKDISFSEQQIKMIKGGQTILLN